MNGNPQEINHHYSLYINHVSFTSISRKFVTFHQKQIMQFCWQNDWILQDHKSSHSKMLHPTMAANRKHVKVSMMAMVSNSITITWNEWGVKMKWLYKIYFQKKENNLKSKSHSPQKQQGNSNSYKTTTVTPVPGLCKKIF